MRGFKQVVFFFHRCFTLASLFPAIRRSHRSKIFVNDVIAERINMYTSNCTRQRGVAVTQRNLIAEVTILN